MPKTLKDVNKMEFNEKSSTQPPPIPGPAEPLPSKTSRVRVVNLSQLPEQIREIGATQNNNKSKSEVKVKSSVNDRSPRSETSTSPRPSGNIHQPKTDILIKWIHGVMASTNTRAQLKEHVDRAIRDQKVFTILGICEPIQYALFSRGWVEKPSVEISFQLHYTKPPEGKPDTKLLKMYFDRADSIHETLKECTANLIWNASPRLISWREIEDNQMVNQSPGAKAAFCSKVGITDCVLDSHWFRDSETIDLKFPRCYRLDSEDEKSVFVNDFRLTACVALLRWLIDNFEQHGLGGVVSIAGTGKTRWWAVDFALSQIQYYSKVRQNEDLDGGLEQPTNYTTQWDNFVQQYSKIVLGRLKLPSEIKLKEAKEIVEQAKTALLEIKPYWTHMNEDGINNLWICKPAYGCRGLGIIISNRLDEIFAVQKPKAPASGVYDGKNVVAQKYIEKPFLILKTKFDIRQWFFISCWNPISVWLYKDCYLRFCAAPYDLERLHPKIHLCNTAVQRPYKVANKYRDTDLPIDDVWELKTFRKHLKDIGKEDTWETIIYPGIKKSLLSVVLPAQKILLDGSIKKIRQNSFEIYGADFLLSEDLTPWLLEINSGPVMQAASSKIMKLSKQCLEDCIKVVIDRRIDPEAQTGKFELIYKQTQPQGVYIQAQKGNIVVLGTSALDGPSKSTSTSPNSKAQKSNKKMNPTKKRNYMEVNTVNAEADHSNFSATRIRNALRRFFQENSSQQNVVSDKEGKKLEKKSSSRFHVETGGEHTPKAGRDSLEKILGGNSSENRHMSKSRSLSELSMENNISTPDMRVITSGSIKGRRVAKKGPGGFMPSVNVSVKKI